MNTFVYIFISKYVHKTKNKNETNIGERMDGRSLGIMWKIRFCIVKLLISSFDGFITGCFS